MLAQRSLSGRSPAVVVDLAISKNATGTSTNGSKVTNTVSPAIAVAKGSYLRKPPFMLMSKTFSQSLNFLPARWRSRSKFEACCARMVLTKTPQNHQSAVRPVRSERRSH